METLSRNREDIKDYLESLDTDDLRRVNNQYCQNADCMDDEIMVNDEDFFDTYFPNVNEAVRAVCYGDYEYTAPYVKINVYGNLETMNSIDLDDLDVEYIIDDILENPEDYDIELEDEKEKVVIETVEDGTYSVIVESGATLEGDFETYEDAEEWAEDNNCEIVESFNL